jgi:hypothetical protein
MVPINIIVSPVISLAEHRSEIVLSRLHPYQLSVEYMQDSVYDFVARRMKARVPYIVCSCCCCIFVFVLVVVAAAAVVGIPKISS